MSADFINLDSANMETIVSEGMNPKCVKNYAVKCGNVLTDILENVDTTQNLETASLEIIDILATNS